MIRLGLSGGSINNNNIPKTSNLYTKDYDINDVRIAVRNVLTKVKYKCFSLGKFVE